MAYSEKLWVAVKYNTFGEMWSLLHKKNNIVFVLA